MSKDKTQMYYIRTRGYLGNALMWWAKKSIGYTSDINRAEKYTFEQAKSICKRDKDTAYRCDYIDNLHKAKKIIIDSQFVDSKEQLFNE